MSLFYSLCSGGICMLLKTFCLILHLTPLPYITSYWNTSQDILPDTFTLIWLPLLISTIIAMLSMRMNVYFITFVNLLVTTISFKLLLENPNLNPVYYEVLGVDIAYIFTIILYVFFPFFIRTLMKIWGVRIL